MIVNYGDTPTLLTSVQSIGKPVRMLDGWMDLVITVEDFEGALYATWYNKQGTHIEVKDNTDTYYYFIGTVTDIKNYTDKMVLVCSPVGRILKKRNFKKNYIYAEGKLKSNPPYAASNNKIEVETKDDEDFTWDNDEHHQGDRDRGILLLDKTDSAEKVWVPSSETTADDDSNDGWAAADTNAQDAVNYAVADSGLTRDASTIFALSGVKVPNGSYIQKIQIEYRFGLSCDAAAFGLENLRLSIYNYDTPAWETVRDFTGYSSGGVENVEWFEGSLAQENTIDFLGTAAELAKLLNTNDGYDELKLKFELVGDYSAATDVKMIFDFFQVTIFYETADFSPVMGKITDNGASWIESTDIDFVAKSITEDDAFLIGDNVIKIAQEAFATTGIQSIVDPNFTKYIARYFGGNAEAAIMAVQSVEKAHLFDYYIGGVPILKLMLESSFETVSGAGVIGHTDNPITSAHYAHDFHIESPDNQYKEVIVYGNSYWGVEARAQDRDPTNTSQHQLTVTDDTIATYADAQEIADALLAFLKVVRKSVVVTLSGAGYETLQPGMSVYATFERPTIVKTAYPIRRIEKSQGVDGVSGIEITTLYLGMGKTPTAERIARFIENSNRTLQKIKTYRVTPSGFGGIPSSGEIDTSIAIHAAIAAAHHAKYTDAEAVTAMGVKGDANPLHHDIWTTADTEGVITAEIVGGESIDNAIDALILDHKNLEDDHHKAVEDEAYSANWSNHDASGISGKQLHLKFDSIDKNIEGLRGLITIKGAWDASTETYPAAPDTGDGWINDTQHTWGALQFEVWDWIVWNGYTWIHIHTLGQELSLKVNVGESIQDAVDLVLAAGGGTVLLMEGTHDLAGTSLTIDDGDGTKTLRIIGMGNLSIIDVGGAVHGFNIDAGKDIGHLTLKDFKIDCNDFTGEQYGIFYDEPSNNPCIIDNITIVGDGTHGWLMKIDSENVEIKNCHLTDSSIGIYVYSGGGSYANIHNNWIQGMASTGIAVNDASDYVTIKDNHIEDCALNGIYCESQYFLIEGNRIIDSEGAAITIVEDGHGSIVDNIIYDFVTYGIYINADHITVTSNSIEYGHRDDATDLYGIYMDAGNDYITVSANVVTNVKNVGAGDGYGITTWIAVVTLSIVGNVTSNCDKSYLGGYIYEQGKSFTLVDDDETQITTIRLQPATNDIALLNRIDTVGNGAYFRFLDNAGAYTRILASAFTISSNKVKSSLEDILNIDFDAEDWKEQYPDDVKHITKDEPIGLNVGVMAQLALKGVKELQKQIEDLKKEIG